MDVNVRKALAGADSYGNTWPEDGSVVSVPYEQALDLIAIKDAGFTVVDPEPTVEPATEAEPELSEVDPEAPEGEPTAEDSPEQPKPAAKKAAARKTAAKKPVEE